VRCSPMGAGSRPSLSGGCGARWAGQLARSTRAGYDVIDAAGHTWEVRAVTQSGISFCPSGNTGKDRRFNREAFLRKLDQLIGYACCVLHFFPIVLYWLVPAASVRRWYEHGRLGNNAKVSDDRFFTLLLEMRSRSR
jgi:hypothetical protein